MMYKSHLTVSAAIALPILSVTHELNYIAVGGVLIGSLLPDIDHPQSYIGRKVWVLAKGINIIFGHRGIVHSLLPVLLLAIASSMLDSLFLWCITLGFLLHLIEDGFSKGGLGWFQPLKKKKLIIPFKLVRYTTGGFKEYCIFIIFVALLIFEIIYLKNITHTANLAIDKSTDIINKGGNMYNHAKNIISI